MCLLMCSLYFLDLSSFAVALFFVSLICGCCPSFAADSTSFLAGRF